MKSFTSVLLLAASVCISSAVGQAPPPPPPAAQTPYYGPQDLEQIVAQIALYPDPLLAQVLTASTYWNQIPDAASWSRQHSYLVGDQLARAIAEDNLPWDASVLGLLPFPSVLDMMAGNMAWTQDLGQAVLTNRAAVMDAIQDQRQRAYNYGYLRTNAQYRVVTPAPGDIEILPVNPAFIYVPFYDPGIVFFRPRAGFFVGGAITFGPAIGVGFFAPFGWGGIGFGWGAHTIIVNNRPWDRTWVNRGAYVHPYVYQRPRAVAPRMERHELREWGGPERGGERGRR
jgi:hypothetical protein